MIYKNKSSDGRGLSETLESEYFDSKLEAQENNDGVKKKVDKNVPAPAPQDETKD